MKSLFLPKTTLSKKAAVTIGNSPRPMMSNFLPKSSKLKVDKEVHCQYDCVTPGPGQYNVIKNYDPITKLNGRLGFRGIRPNDFGAKQNITACIDTSKGVSFKRANFHTGRNKHVEFLKPGAYDWYNLNKSDTPGPADYTPNSIADTRRNKRREDMVVRTMMVNHAPLPYVNRKERDKALFNRLGKSTKRPQPGLMTQVDPNDEILAEAEINTSNLLASKKKSNYTEKKDNNYVTMGKISSTINRSLTSQDSNLAIIPANKPSVTFANKPEVQKVQEYTYSDYDINSNFLNEEDDPAEPKEKIQYSYSDYDFSDLSDLWTNVIREEEFTKSGTPTAFAGTSSAGPNEKKLTYTYSDYDRLV